MFYNTIQNINKNDYPQDEIDDWSSWHKDFDKWSDRIREQYFVIAQLDSTIVGFASLAKDGYLDFLFVHKDFQRQGIAFALLNELERKAVEQNNALIYSDVSITARAFLKKMDLRLKNSN